MKSYTICFVLVGLVAGVTLAFDKEQFKQTMEKCLEENKLTADEMKKFAANGFKAEEATENMKCHSKCVLEKQGHFKNGVFDDKAAMESVAQMPEAHQGKITEAITTCKGEKGANECDTAFKISTCIAKIMKHQ